MKLFSRTDKSFLGRWWWTVDRGLISAFMVLVVFGIVLITTASPPVARHLGLGEYHFLIRHLIMLVPALGIMFFTSMLEKRQVWRLASLGLIGALLAMIIVLATGMEIKGAQRWIHIFGFSLQPSEFAKPCFVIVAAWLMSLQKTRENFQGNYYAAGLYLFVVTLLLLQPDLGMTFIVTCCWAAQIFLAGFPFRLLLAFGGLGIVGLITAYFSFHHVHSRINRFLDPESGDNFQVEKSLEAFQNGGFLGAGPGQGSVKLHLPDAHADFIFSVAGEELGLVFILVIVLVFGFILLRGYNRLMESDDMFTVLGAGGLLTMFGLQALVHMGSALNLLPAKGMTLPFISYGGSSVLSMGFAMGAVLALTRKQKRSGVSKGGLSHSLKAGRRIGKM
ncbi:MAG: cell division protein FtsW [Alphaproteobacteria bacterium]|nr:cell division protein FtsW [Alphaproteobacteria bacterium]